MEKNGGLKNLNEEISGIECINLLAFIQFIIVFDFGLYYFDDKHILIEIYRKYQLDLQTSSQKILDRTEYMLKESLKSDSDKCKIQGGYLDKPYRRLRHLIDEGNLNLEGCGFIGLYAGLYGLLCLFGIGMFKSRYEASAKNYILIISQIILVIELLISWYNHQEDCGKYSRNLWSNIRLCIIITVFAVALVEFDLTYGYFSEFELPFVIISLIILLFPFILFIGHIIVARMEITILKLKCRYYIRQVENCLQVHDDHTQG